MDTNNPFYFFMGYIISKIVKRKEIPMEDEKLKENTTFLKEEYCIGCGICEKIAPEYFKVRNKKANILNKNFTG